MNRQQYEKTNPSYTDAYEFLGITLPALPPEFKWIWFVGEPAVAVRSSTADQFLNFPHGWVTADPDGFGVVVKNPTRSPEVRHLILELPYEQAINLLAQMFWMGEYE